MTLQRELMARCRWLVENRGKRTGSGQMVEVDYRDQVVRVTWTYPKPEVPYGPGYPSSHLTVTDWSTGLVIGSYTDTSGGCGLETPRAQEIVDHLRSIMLLDDFARAI